MKNKFKIFGEWLVLIITVIGFVVIVRGCVGAIETQGVDYYNGMIFDVVTLKHGAPNKIDYAQDRCTAVLRYNNKTIELNLRADPSLTEDCKHEDGVYIVEGSDNEDGQYIIEGGLSKIIK